MRDEFGRRIPKTTIVLFAVICLFVLHSSTVRIPWTNPCMENRYEYSYGHVWFVLEVNSTL